MALSLLRLHQEEGILSLFSASPGVILILSQSRGYRAGTKFLQQASSFGVLASTLALLVFYSANYYFDDPWMSKNIGGGSSWLVFFTSRVCDAFALFFYAGDRCIDCLGNFLV
ncbi:uncharacterized protein EMH_0077460 [Eimeria mitis]|uniref:Uncharacterized protein n=1 Tax=Eimeria mitis TaxID=44415 RepID=U6JN73_9EIME|nr:uncharacterized protein EMH_0077460 [Eimeria mitis]CDJ26959.1 hypothetical protein EMH_0077460 [Eimeria mitis]